MKKREKKFLISVKFLNLLLLILLGGCVPQKLNDEWRPPILTMSEEAESFYLSLPENAAFDDYIGKVALRECEMIEKIYKGKCDGEYKATD